MMTDKVLKFEIEGGYVEIGSSEIIDFSINRLSENTEDDPYLEVVTKRNSLGQPIQCFQLFGHDAIRIAWQLLAHDAMKSGVDITCFRNP